MINKLTAQFEDECIQKIGDIFKGNRERLGVSIRELAHQLDCSQTYAGALERGTNGLPGEDFLVRAAVLFGMDTDVLLGSAAKVASDVRIIIAKNPKGFSRLIRALEKSSDKIAFINDGQIERIINILNGHIISE